MPPASEAAVAGWPCRMMQCSRQLQCSIAVDSAGGAGMCYAFIWQARFNKMPATHVRRHWAHDGYM